MGFGKAKYTPEQIKEIKKVVKENDITDGYSLKSEVDLPPEKADIFTSIQSLPQKERTVVHLFYYEDMTVDEIAEITKSKSSTVKTRLQRARKRLKTILGDDWIDEQ